MASLVRINERQLPAVFRSFHTARIRSLLLPSCREISARMACSSCSANHLCRWLLPTRFQETIGVTLESCGELTPAMPSVVGVIHLCLAPYSTRYQFTELEDHTVSRRYFAPSTLDAAAEMLATV
eukprot:scaffold82225_cov30-Phaeocystis_antarctica.AAC.2